MGIKFDEDPLALEKKQLLKQNCKFLSCLWIIWLAKYST